MTPADIASAILRGTDLAALMSLFGTLLFVRTLARVSRGHPLHERLSRLAFGSLLVAMTLGAAWFLLRAASIAGAETVRQAIAALPVVALHTQFGQLLLARFAILVVLLPLIRRNGVGAIALAAAALGLQPAIGHAGAMEGFAGYSLMCAEILHVLAAGTWLGALVPLLICLASIPSDDAAVVLRRFFPFGLTAVCVIAATSVVQSVVLVASVPALFGTAYGRVALLKLLLFLLLLIFAAANRFVFTSSRGAGLRRSISGEVGFALAVTLAAGFLAHLTPGAHEQPVWPFAWRIDLEKPGPVLVPAYPTSFFTSPTGFSVSAIVHGKLVYQTNCAACHGATGQGDGPIARTLPAAPADLTARRLMEYSEGELYWFAGHAVDTTEDDRWDLIDYLRAHNTGEFVRTANRGVQPLRTPLFNASCADGRTLLPEDLRGQVVRLVIPPENEPALISPALVSPALDSIDGDKAFKTILVAEANSTMPNAAGCLAQQETGDALAILLGTTPDSLAGTQLLIDSNGWLRARWKPGELGGWPTSERLSSRIRTLTEHPLPAVSTKAHHH
jgi:putative copper export protein